MSGELGPDGLRAPVGRRGGRAGPGACLLCAGVHNRTAPRRRRSPADIDWLATGISLKRARSGLFARLFGARALAFAFAARGTRPFPSCLPVSRFPFPASRFPP